ncbi:MAG: hypothetical protein HYY06_30745 [Deltaproteobacteria bacterium]|nr:hypothetical protein [Deltaproteobacteria bacterium]
MPWIGLVAAGGAALLGRDVALRSGARGLVELLYWTVVATAGIPALQAQWALYERADRMALLPLPIPPGVHLRDAARVAAAKVCPLALMLLGLAAGGLAGGLPARPALEAVVMVAVSTLTAFLAGFGVAALAGRAAMRSTSPALETVRRALAGGWSLPEHAPFFWAPGLAVALVAFAAAGVQRGLFPGAIAVACTVALACAAPAAYRRALFEVAPLAAEHARSIYGGQPPPAPSPVGLSLGVLLPRAARPFFVKDATQIGRLARGHGVLAALGVAGLTIAALRTGSAPWVACAAVGLVGAFGMAAIRVSRPDASPAWLERVLPAPSSARILGRAAAAAILPAVTGLALALGLAIAGAPLARTAYVAAIGLPLAAAAALAPSFRRAASWAYGLVVGGAATAAAWVA